MSSFVRLFVRFSCLFLEYSMLTHRQRRWLVEASYAHFVSTRSIISIFVEGVQMSQHLLRLHLIYSLRAGRLGDKSRRGSRPMRMKEPCV
ncbi:hypothetical protein VTO42DRAFT_6789 [Malbranchea cinnamomea]